MTKKSFDTIWVAFGAVTGAGSAASEGELTWSGPDPVLGVFSWDIAITVASGARAAWWKTTLRQEAG